MLLSCRISLETPYLIKHLMNTLIDQLANEELQAGATDLFLCEGQITPSPYSQRRSNSRTLDSE